MRLFRGGPRTVGTVRRARGDKSRNPSTDAICTFFEDKTNFVVFKLQGRAGGAVGNAWKVLLYKVSSGRFSFRLVNPAGDILVTITRTGGVANLMSAVNANATVNRLVTMRIVGTIDDDTAFSSSITDYCGFKGGS